MNKEIIEELSRIKSILEYENEKNIVADMPIAVVDTQDYFHGIEHATDILEKRIAELKGEEE